MHQLYYKSSALHTIKKFNAQERAVFRRTIAQLQEFPEAGGFLKGSLKGLRKWKYRVQSVPYRIVYRVDKNRIDIVATGKRKDLYDLLDQ